MTTNEEILDAGVVFDGSQNDLDRWSNAFYKAMLGSDRTGGGIGLGAYLRRVAKTITGQTVTANVHKADLPGPIIHVEAITATLPGPKQATVVAAPLSGQCKITTGADGRDTIEFNAGDNVSICAYRQLTMSVEMHTNLLETSVPA